MTTLLDHWIFLGLALSLLYLPYFLLRGGLDRLMALFVLCLGLIQAQGLWGLHSAVLQVWHQLALYPVAALLYLYFVGLQGETVGWQRSLRHLSPLVAIVVLLLVQVLQPALAQRARETVYVLSFLSGAAYSLAIMRRLRTLAQPTGLMRAEALLLMLAAVAGIVIAVLVVAAGLLVQPAFFKVYGSLLTALLVLGHFLILLYPHLPEVLADELRDATAAVVESTPSPTVTPAAATSPTSLPRRRSQLGGVDLDSALAEVQRLLSEDGLYRRYDLTLPLLADQAGLSVHQLSELINNHLGMSFPRLIKNYRIAEAKQLLCADPQRSALDIGLAVGFTSLSAFYAAFRELEGMAPGQYRKQASASH